jgi:two-component system chemotaxis response regulator CheB
MPKLRVLIVDDAVVVRRILTDALSAEPDLEVFGAANGRIALAKIPQVNPDIVTLDMEMPEMDGLTTLRELRKLYPKLPVIMFSTLTERGAAATLDALAAGANDYVTKPANVGSVAAAFSRIKADLIPRIKALCGVREPEPIAPAPVKAAGSATPLRVASGVGVQPIDIVAIGVSTGGPNALSVMLPMLPKDLPVPVVIVQHMPPLFTKLLAERLAVQCQLGVREGAPGMIVNAGEITIAPGGSHMVVQRLGNNVVVGTNMLPPQNSCRPAVDVLFRSVAYVYGGRTLGVILTGMGNDGLRGCEMLREAGGQVIVQDEASSVVWGMPGFVARAGLARKILPLDQVAGEIVRCVNQGRQATPLAKAS